jgi:hypothetical protein
MFLAAVWVSACTAILAVAYVQREIHDMPEAVLWLMIILSFPAGLIGIVAAGWVSYLLRNSTALSEIHQFWAIVPYWAIAVTLGYLQWFAAVPTLWRRFKKTKVK